MIPCRLGKIRDKEWNFAVGKAGFTVWACGIVNSTGEFKTGPEAKYHSPDFSTAAASFGTFLTLRKVRIRSISTVRQFLNKHLTSKWEMLVTNILFIHVHINFQEKTPATQNLANRVPPITKKPYKSPCNRGTTGDHKILERICYSLNSLHVLLIISNTPSRFSSISLL